MEEITLIYRKGISIYPQDPINLLLKSDEIIEWKVFKMKGWASPNIRIKLIGRPDFETPVLLIDNFHEVHKFLKKNNGKR